jgi:hypothetical protein
VVAALAPSFDCPACLGRRSPSFQPSGALMLHYSILMHCESLTSFIDMFT